MKNLFIILLSLLSFTGVAQVKVVGYLTPNGVATYPTHIDSLGKGGWVTVADIAARNAITTDRRKPAMIAALSDGTVYQLLGGMDNVNWVRIYFNQESNQIYQWSVLDSLNSPPTTPLPGGVYLVGTSASGDFAGHANDIATYDSITPYTFETPAVGNLLYNASNYIVSRWTDTVWVRLPPPQSVNWWANTNRDGVPGQFARVGNQLPFMSWGTDRNAYGWDTWHDIPGGNPGSIAIGSISQHHNRSSAHDNISIGNYSLWYALTGSKNIAIGQNSGDGSKSSSISLGYYAKADNNQLKIQDDVTKLSMNLDSAAGAAPSIVGTDNFGNWHRYATPAGTSTNIYNTISTPADPAAGKAVLWFDGTNFKIKKNVGGTVTSTIIL